MKQLKNVLKFSFASLLFLSALLYSDSNIESSGSDNVLIDTESMISQDLMNLFSSYFEGQSKVEHLESDNSKLESSDPKSSHSHHHSTKPTSKKRKRNFLKSLIKNCGRVLAGLAKLVVPSEAVNILTQIPKLAGKLLHRFDADSKQMDLVENDEINLSIALLSEEVLNFIKLKGIKDIPSNLNYLRTLNSFTSYDDRVAFSRKIANEFGEICLHEVFLVLSDFLKDKYKFYLDEINLDERI